VPYQSNGWDCGVFVCRYAYGFKCLQTLPFTYDDVGFVPGNTANWFENAITDSDAFRFRDRDIVSLRANMKTLIERLSEVYSPWSQAQKRNRQSEKKSKSESDAAPVAEERSNDASVSPFDVSNQQGDIDDTMESIARETNALHLGTAARNDDEVEDLRILRTSSANKVFADEREVDDGTPIKTAEMCTVSSDEQGGNEVEL
jgi:hypothetical protein